MTQGFSRLKKEGEQLTEQELFLEKIANGLVGQLLSVSSSDGLPRFNEVFSRTFYEDGRPTAALCIDHLTVAVRYDAKNNEYLINTYSGIMPEANLQNQVYAGINENLIPKVIGNQLSAVLAKEAQFTKPKDAEVQTESTEPEYQVKEVKELSPREVRDRLFKELQAANPGVKVTFLPDKGENTPSVTKVDQGRSLSYNFQVGSTPCSFSTLEDGRYYLWVKDQKEVRYANRSYEVDVPVESNEFNLKEITADFRRQDEKEKMDAAKKQADAAMRKAFELDGKAAQKLEPATGEKPETSQQVLEVTKIPDSQMAVSLGGDMAKAMAQAAEDLAKLPEQRTSKPKAASSAKSPITGIGKLPDETLEIIYGVDFKNGIPQVKSEGSASKYWGKYKGDNQSEIFEVLKWARNEAKVYGTDVDMNKFISFIEHESGSNPNTVSNTGATGLGQFTEATWNDAVNKRGWLISGKTLKEVYPDVNWDDRKDIVANALASAHLTARRVDMYKSTHSDKGDLYVDVYIAHNLGEGGARHFLRNELSDPDAKVTSPGADKNPANYKRNGKMMSYEDSREKIEDNLDFHYRGAIRRGFEPGTKDTEIEVRKIEVEVIAKDQAPQKDIKVQPKKDTAALDPRFIESTQSGRFIG